MIHFFRKLRDPVSGLSHLAAAFLSIEGLILLERYSMTAGTVWHSISLTIFGVSLISLYSASAMYHLLPLSSHALTILRRIDHAMIFVLIAGTYTPVCLIPLRGFLGWCLFGVIWLLALAGIVQSLFWIQAPRWLSTTFYLVMGWLIIIAFYPIVLSIPAGGIFWLVLGGLCYSGGAVIYALKKPDFFPGVFGFHEFWHLFVMAGSLCHFLAIYFYVSPMR